MLSSACMAVRPKVMTPRVECADERTCEPNQRHLELAQWKSHLAYSAQVVLTTWLLKAVVEPQCWVVKDCPLGRHFLTYRELNTSWQEAPSLLYCQEKGFSTGG